MAPSFDGRTAACAVGLSFGVLVSGYGPLAAQNAAPAAKDSKPAAEVLKERDQELKDTRAEQKKSAETEKQLRAQIEQIGEDRRKLGQALLDGAAKVRDLENRIAETETRLRGLEDKERTLRNALSERRAVIGEILAALQRMGRNPPPAILVKPEDALESVRSAILLGAVLPDMRDKAHAIATDLAELVRVRTGIAAEKDRQARDLAALAEDRQRVTLLIEERQKQQAAAEKALDAERQRAAALARQVDNLRDLIAALEQSLDSAGRAAAKRSEEEAKSGNLAALKDPGRLQPAVAFASARKMLPMPVNGVRIRDFGNPDGLGGVEKGISIATRAGAQVTSPCDGWVVYAGPFRSYGQLLILNAGGGYHVLLAGMERISVDLGQFVLTGEPVAMMGSGSQLATTVPIGSSQPVLYIEFRKDGVPVDSSPWWATGESEKVRG
jgi:septal ring factor EnvC (AmiA/AmiB activator)